MYCNKLFCIDIDKNSLRMIVIVFIA